MPWRVFLGGGGGASGELPPVGQLNAPMLAPTLTPTPTPTPEPVAPAQKTGININPGLPGGVPTVQELRDLGVGLVRVVYSVKNPNFSKEEFDKLVKVYLDNGIAVDIVLTQDSVDIPLPQFNNVAYPTYLLSFSKMAGDLAQKYQGKPVRFEIWNEEDEGRGGVSAIPLSPIAYAGLLSGTFAAIKSVNSAPVLVGGLINTNPDYLRAVIKASNGKLPADGIGVHIYTNQGLSDVDKSLNAFAEFNAPIWITEFGIVHPDAGARYDFVKGVYTYTGNKANVGGTIVYTWDDPVQPIFSLMRGGSADELWQAVKDFTRTLPSPTPTPVPIPTEKPWWNFLFQ